MTGQSEAMQRTGEMSLVSMFRTFLMIGLLSFGGPAAQIALMHRSLVEENGWLSEQQFLNARGFCMLLPGPEAMQLATYAGWRLAGVAGGLLAGLLFVLPGALIIFALAYVYVVLGDVPVVASLFLGIKAAVLAVVLEALLRVSKRALKQRAHWIIAGLAFVGIFFLTLPFPLIVFAAALYGAIWITPTKQADQAELVLRVPLAQTAKTVALWLSIWLVPLAVIGMLADAPVLGQIGFFFSKLAVVTFGGAYAVLAYMAQDVVSGFGWLTAGEMMDGLGLAETTPGPLILVTQFVGFLAGTGQGGLSLGFAGGAVALWATFAPCFLWIFAGAPYIDWISSQGRLSAALSAITASVVGVILNLSIWFALHVFFADVTHLEFGYVTFWVPDIATLDFRVLFLSVLAAFLLLRIHLALGWVLLISAFGGLVLSML